MTNVREYKKFIDPILKADPDLVFSRGSIFVTPIRHVFRAIAFHSTSWRTGMKITVEIRPICALRGDRPVGFAFPNQYWPRQNYWESDRPGFLESLHEAITVECLPRLKAAPTFELCQALFEAHYDPEYHTYHNLIIFFHLTAGRFGLVDEIMAHPRAGVQREVFSHVVPEISDDLANGCARLPKKRKREILQYLHEREAKVIRYFKLEKHWQPTPFPAEEEGLV